MAGPAFALSIGSSARGSGLPTGSPGATVPFYFRLCLDPSHQALPLILIMPQCDGTLMPVREGLNLSLKSTADFKTRLRKTMASCALGVSASSGGAAVSLLSRLLERVAYLHLAGSRSRLLEWASTPAGPSMCEHLPFMPRTP